MGGNGVVSESLTSCSLEGGLEFSNHLSFFNSELVRKIVKSSDLSLLLSKGLVSDDFGDLS